MLCASGARDRQQTSMTRLSATGDPAQARRQGHQPEETYRLYREERLTVRKRDGRKRALGTRAAMATSQEPNQRRSRDFVSNVIADYNRPGLHHRYLALSCRAGTDRHRRPSRAVVHGGPRQRDRADQSRCPGLVSGYGRRVALHCIVQWSLAPDA